MDPHVERIARLMKEKKNLNGMSTFILHRYYSLGFQNLFTRFLPLPVAPAVCTRVEQLEDNRL